MSRLRFKNLFRFPACRVVRCWAGLVLGWATVAGAATGQTPDPRIPAAPASSVRAFVLIDVADDTVRDDHPETSSEKLPPCSTFKIWNTLIGLDCGLLTDPDAAFYRWDGEIRGLPDWNRDLTLKEAFQVSCVPAFQQLARRIGPDRMRDGLAKIGYGDGDLSAGIDVFWLPASGRKTVLISPLEQARLISRLVAGRLPFSTNAVRTLKALMLVRRTDKGVLYGKTGSRANDQGRYDLGWFVGFVESRGKAYAFACTVQGDNRMGKDARAQVEQILEARDLL